jgi:hypothetical protein
MGLWMRVHQRFKSYNRSLWDMAMCEYAHSLKTASLSVVKVHRLTDHPRQVY